MFNDLWSYVSSPEEIPFFIKFRKVKSDIHVFLTDMVCLWVYSTDNLSCQVTVKKPLTASARKKLPLRFKITLNEGIKEITSVFLDEQDRLNVYLTATTLDDSLAFHTSFSFEQATSQDFYSEVTFKLLGTITLLRDMKDRLLQAVEAKEEDKLEPQPPGLVQGVPTGILDTKKFMKESVRNVSSSVSKCWTDPIDCEEFNTFLEPMNMKWNSTDSDDEDSVSGEEESDAENSDCEIVEEVLTIEGEASTSTNQASTSTGVRSSVKNGLKDSDDAVVEVYRKKAKKFKRTVDGVDYFITD